MNDTVRILIWPSGDWAYEHEVYDPEPGFVIHKISSLWTDDRVDRYVQQLVKQQLLKPPT